MRGSVPTIPLISHRSALNSCCNGGPCSLSSSLAQLAPQQERILLAIRIHQASIDILLTLPLGLKVAVRSDFFISRAYFTALGPETNPP